MGKRLPLTFAAASALAAVLAPIACATEPGLAQPPAPDAELVSRQVATGVAAARTVLQTVKSIRLGRSATVVTVAGDSGPHAITVNYGEIARDKTAGGAGYLIGAYVLLGAAARLTRTMRHAFGPLG